LPWSAPSDIIELEKLWPFQSVSLAINGQRSRDAAVDEWPLQVDGLQGDVGKLLGDGVAQRGLRGILVRRRAAG